MDRALVDSSFGFTQLIASWQATTPAGSWIELEVRGRTPEAEKTSWDVLGRWTSGDNHVAARASPQSDDLASVNVDTWVAKKGAGSPRQLRVSLFRMPGTEGPSVTLVGAVASRLPQRPGSTSPPGPDVGTSLPCRRTPRWCTRATSRSGAAAVRPGARRPRPRWCSPTTTRCRPRRPTASCRRPPRPVGRLRRPADLRLRLRRHRQLALQHGVRRRARRARLRHPPALAARGRGLHRRRHPARRLGLVGPGRADRRPRRRPATATCW